MGKMFQYSIILELKVTLKKPPGWSMIADESISPAQIL